MDGEDMGRHISTCTKSKIPLDLVWILGNLFLTFFPKAQPRQTKRIKTKHTFHHSMQTRQFSEVNVSKTPMPQLTWDDSMTCHGCNILSQDLVNSSFSNSNNNRNINVLVLRPQECLILHEDGLKAFIFKDRNREQVLLQSRYINNFLHMQCVSRTQMEGCGSNSLD